MMFPGAMYTAAGTRFGARGRPLTLARLHAYQHRAVASLRRGAEPVAVWTLRDDALFRIIPTRYVEHATDFMACGAAAVLLLGNNPDLLQDVRDRLVAAARAEAERIGVAA